MAQTEERRRLQEAQKEAEVWKRLKEPRPGRVEGSCVLEEEKGAESRDRRKELRHE